MAEIEMLHVFLHQEQAPSEEEAKKLLQAAKKEKDTGCLGGRVLPDRTNKRRWLVQTYYPAVSDMPPQGMARLSIPAGADNLKKYGIVKH